MWWGFSSQIGFPHLVGLVFVLIRMPLALVTSCSMECRCNEAGTLYGFCVLIMCVNELLCAHELSAEALLCVVSRMTIVLLSVQHI